MNRIIILPLTQDMGHGTTTIYPTLALDEKEMILVDCGYPGNFPLLEKIAVEEGVDLSRLTKVIITHHDHDHMGSLAELLRKHPHVQVICGIDEVPYVEGREKSLRLRQTEELHPTLTSPQEQKASLARMEMLRSMGYVKVDVPAEDGKTFPCCGGVEIVATPGHMPGHICVLLHPWKTLVAGDALSVDENGELAPGNPFFTLDHATANESLKKLIGYDIDRVICYHGGVFQGDVRSALQRITR